MPQRVPTPSEVPEQVPMAIPQAIAWPGAAAGADSREVPEQVPMAIPQATPGRVTGIQTPASDPRDDRWHRGFREADR